MNSTAATIARLSGRLQSDSSPSDVTDRHTNIILRFIVLDIQKWRLKGFIVTCPQVHLNSANSAAKPNANHNLDPNPNPNLRNGVKLRISEPADK